MTEREAVMHIAKKTRENSLLMPGKVVFGLWNRSKGALLVTDELQEVNERQRLGYEVIRVYADGWELEPIGRRYGEYGEMVYMNRWLYGEIKFK